jgi:hypothetical protein
MLAVLGHIRRIIVDCLRSLRLGESSNDARARVPHDVVAELSGIGPRHFDILRPPVPGKPTQIAAVRAADPCSSLNSRFCPPTT